MKPTVQHKSAIRQLENSPFVGTDFAFFWCIRTDGKVHVGYPTENSTCLSLNHFDFIAWRNRMRF